MAESIIDDLISLQDAVKKGLVSQGFADILVDGGRMRIYAGDVDSAAATVWCEMTIMLEGIVQPLRIEVGINDGRFYREHGSMVEKLVNAVIDEASVIDQRLQQQAVIRRSVNLAIDQAAEDGLIVRLTGLQRMAYDIDGDLEIDGWLVDFLMIERDDEGVVFRRAFTVAQQIGHGYGYESLLQRLRDEEFPAQHHLLRETLENKVAGREAWAAAYPMSDRPRAWTPFGLRA